MINIAHWNTRGSNEIDHAVSLCIDNDLDIVIFSEFAMSSVNFTKSVNKFTSRLYSEVSLNVTRLKIFSRFPPGSISVLYEDRHVAISHLNPPIGESIIIVAAHLPSKLNKNVEEQYHRVRQLIRNLDRVESQLNHSRTIVIGDLNINPFEPAMISADGFHAVMDRYTASKISRTYQEEVYKYFYNPMWSRLGDDSDGPPGTYYYSGSKLEKMAWNTFDQVLLRPDILSLYKKDKLKVITNISGVDIFSDYKIDRSYSDHLPIMISLER